MSLIYEDKAGTVCEADGQKIRENSQDRSFPYYRFYPFVIANRSSPTFFKVSINRYSGISRYIVRLFRRVSWNRTASCRTTNLMAGIQTIFLTLLNRMRAKAHKIKAAFIDILISIDREVVFLWN